MNNSSPLESEFDAQMLHLDLTEKNLLAQNSLPDLEKVETIRFESHELPIELLELVFNFAIPLDGFLDSSLDSGYSITWELVQEDKLSFALVNKAWYQGAIQFLYRHIIIRHLSQVTLLRRTIEETVALQSLPRSICFSCYVPPALAESCNRDIHLLHSLCSTSEFSLHFPIWMPEFDECLLASPPLLTKLSMAEPKLSDDDPVYLGQLFDLVRHNARSLRCLTMSPSVTNYKIDRSPLEFPLLEDLHFFTCYSSLDPIYHLQDFLLTWDLPKLNQFSFESVPSITTVPSTLTLFGTFLERNGPSLHTLRILGEGRGTPDVDDHVGRLAPTLQTILDFCPNLEHLILGADYGTYNSPGLHHAALKYIDIWIGSRTIYPTVELGHAYTPRSFMCGERSYEQENVASDTNSPNNSESPVVTFDDAFTSFNSQSNFPQLRSVRGIDCDLSYLPNLPLILHPKWFGHANDEWLLFSLPGRTIQVSAGIIFPIENLAPDSGIFDSDSDGSSWFRSYPADTTEDSSSYCEDTPSESDSMMLCTSSP